MKRFLLLGCLGFAVFAIATESSAEGELTAEAINLPTNDEGQRLARDLRHAWPEEDARLTGTLKIRRRGKPTQRIPIGFRVTMNQDSWRTVYTVPSSSEQAPEQELVIVHRPGHPNDYEYHRQGQSPQSLDLFQAFGGSDFSIADLGLDFLHWPGQRLIKTEMRKGRWCRVLESTRETPHGHGYRRVISWLDKEQGQPILAEAYDSDGNLLKEFSIGSFKKVDGQWRLEDMKIINVQARSRTELEFDLE